MVLLLTLLGLVTQILLDTYIPPHWRAEQARTIIYKPYASTEFTLNQYNEFAGVLLCFLVILFVYVPFIGLKKKKKMII